MKIKFIFEIIKREISSKQKILSLRLLHFKESLLDHVPELRHAIQILYVLSGPLGDLSGCS